MVNFNFHIFDFYTLHLSFILRNLWLWPKGRIGMEGLEVWPAGWKVGLIFFVLGFGVIVLDLILIEDFYFLREVIALLFRVFVVQFVTNNVQVAGEPLIRAVNAGWILRLQVSTWLINILILICLAILQLFFQLQSFIIMMNVIEIDLGTCCLLSRVGIAQWGDLISLILFNTT